MSLSVTHCWLSPDCSLWISSQLRLSKTGSCHQSRLLQRYMHADGSNRPVLRPAAPGSTGCCGPTRWCWTGGGQPAHRCCRCPGRAIRCWPPASGPGCRGVHSGCWDTAQRGPAGWWAPTSGRCSSRSRCDWAWRLRHQLRRGWDWSPGGTEGFGPAGLLQGEPHGESDDAETLLEDAGLVAKEGRGQTIAFTRGE